MATQKTQKKSSKTNKNRISSSKGQTQRKDKSNIQNNQVSSIVLFTTAILILCILLIQGAGVWNFLHKFLLGLLGIGSYFVPFILGYVAVMLALEKTNAKFKYNLVSSNFLILLLGATIEVFSHEILNMSYIDFIKEAYLKGISLKGGGFLGGAISYPLTKLTGEMPAKIVVVLLLFATLMIITNTTLRSLGVFAAKPIQKAKELHLQRQAEIEQARFNVDVAIDDLPTHPIISQAPLFDEVNNNLKKQSEEKEEKAKRVVDTYHEVPQVESTLDESQKPSAQKLGKKEKDEKKEEFTIKDNTATPAKSATEEFTAKVESGVNIESASDYKFPPIELLNESKNANVELVDAEIKSNCEHLVNILRSFGVEVRVTGFSRGPSVTRYEIQLSVGVRMNKITNLADDIALQLRAPSVRISPIPNKSAIGIEVPNTNASLVGMRDILSSTEYLKPKSKLTTILGKDVSGNIAICDLAKMPHLLVAGTTGSGKSVCLNSLILSILYKATPDEVKFVMIDPKDVEFRVYNGIPHQLVPVVSDPHKAAGALGWAVVEMDKRYKILAESGVRNLASYNELCKTNPNLKPMPQIVIIIDEFADLMMVSGNEVENYVCRIAQKARAAGMHLVIATQRPSADIFTGLIKSNIPSRIALSVSSQVNSQIILDMGGAEKLMGKGDMLYYPVGYSKPVRVQGCFVSDKEINSVVNFIKNQGEKTEYDQSVLDEIEKQATQDKKGSKTNNDIGFGEDSDERMDDAIEVVVEAGIASTSLLQRKLKLGYARAARIIDVLEERGIVGPFEGSKPRKVLITKQQWVEMQARGSSTSGSVLEEKKEDVVED